MVIRLVVFAKNDLGWVDQKDIDSMDPFKGNDSAADLLGGLR